MQVLQQRLFPTQHPPPWEIWKMQIHSEGVFQNLVCLFEGFGIFRPSGPSSTIAFLFTRSNSSLIEMSFWWFFRNWSKSFGSCDKITSKSLLPSLFSRAMISFFNYAKLTDMSAGQTCRVYYNFCKVFLKYLSYGLYRYPIPFCPKDKYLEVFFQKL